MFVQSGMEGVKPQTEDFLFRLCEQALFYDVISIVLERTGRGRGSNTEEFKNLSERTVECPKFFNFCVVSCVSFLCSFFMTVFSAFFLMGLPEVVVGAKKRNASWPLCVTKIMSPSFD